MSETEIIRNCVLLAQLLNCEKHTRTIHDYNDIDTFAESYYDENDEEFPHQLISTNEDDPTLFGSRVSFKAPGPDPDPEDYEETHAKPKTYIMCPFCDPFRAENSTFFEYNSKMYKKHMAAHHGITMDHDVTIPFIGWLDKELQFVCPYSRQTKDDVVPCLSMFDLNNPSNIKNIFLEYYKHVYHVHLLYGHRVLSRKETNYQKLVEENPNLDGQFIAYDRNICTKANNFLRSELIDETLDPLGIEQNAGDAQKYEDSINEFIKSLVSDTVKAKESNVENNSSQISEESGDNVDLDDLDDLDSVEFADDELSEDELYGVEPSDDEFSDFDSDDISSVDVEFSDDDDDHPHRHRHLHHHEPAQGPQIPQAHRINAALNNYYHEHVQRPQIAQNPQARPAAAAQNNHIQERIRPPAVNNHEMELIRAPPNIQITGFYIERRNPPHLQNQGSVRAQFENINEQNFNNYHGYESDDGSITAVNSDVDDVAPRNEPDVAFNSDSDTAVDSEWDFYNGPGIIAFGRSSSSETDSDTDSESDSEINSATDSESNSETSSGSYSESSSESDGDFERYLGFDNDYHRDLPEVDHEMLDEIARRFVYGYRTYGYHTYDGDTTDSEATNVGDFSGEEFRQDDDNEVYRIDTECGSDSDSDGSISSIDTFLLEGDTEVESDIDCSVLAENYMNHLIDYQLSSEEDENVNINDDDDDDDDNDDDYNDNDDGYDNDDEDNNDDNEDFDNNDNNDNNEINEINGDDHNDNDDAANNEGNTGIDNNDNQLTLNHIHIIRLRLQRLASTFNSNIQRFKPTRRHHIEIPRIDPQSVNGPYGFLFRNELPPRNSSRQGIQQPITESLLTSQLRHHPQPQPQSEAQPRYDVFQYFDRTDLHSLADSEEDEEAEDNNININSNFSSSSDSDLYQPSNYIAAANDSSSISSSLYEDLMRYPHYPPIHVQDAEAAAQSGGDTPSTASWHSNTSAATSVTTAVMDESQDDDVFKNAEEPNHHHHHGGEVHDSNSATGEEDGDDTDTGDYSVLGDWINRGFEL